MIKRSMEAVAMPAALAAYWRMWNSLEEREIRKHAGDALHDQMVFSDPMHLANGRDALIDYVILFRSSSQKDRFRITSELTEQHGCYRYTWEMHRGARVLMQGMDVARLSTAGVADGESGLVHRVDGFFGPLIPLDPDPTSGVPIDLRTSAEV